jgi:N-carbamoylputrescine amidase
VNVRVALAQIKGAPYAAAENRARTVEVARRAFGDGADLVVLPELIVSGYVTDGERLREIAEPVDGPTVAAWREAADAGGGIVVGGFCEREGDSLYNSAVAVDAGGLLLHYRKVHLFAGEKNAFAPGDLGFPIAETRIGTIGLCVCYDLRFVEVVRLLALRGVQLVCVPTAWLPGFDAERLDAQGMCPQAHGAVLQANLSQVFIACASQSGLAGELDFLGSSVLADPYGKRTLGPLQGEDEVAAAEIDVAETARAQVRAPLVSPRADRRTDVYGLWSADGEIL